MANKATLTIEDKSRETSTFSINIGPLTAANFLAKRQAIDDLENAVYPIILGEHRRTSISEVFPASAAAVTVNSGNRELKWLVTLQDTTQFFDVGNTISNPGYLNYFQVEIPTANDDLVPVGTDFLALDASQDVIDFVAALEAVANSPTGGNEVAVRSIKLVGRNL